MWYWSVTVKAGTKEYELTTKARFVRKKDAIDDLMDHRDLLDEELVNLEGDGFSQVEVIWESESESRGPGTNQWNGSRRDSH